MPPLSHRISNKSMAYVAECSSEPGSLRPLQLPGSRIHRPQYAVPAREVQRNYLLHKVLHGIYEFTCHVSGSYNLHAPNTSRSL